MEALLEPEIRASFVNCTKGEARRLNLPRDLTEQPWSDLDYLGWRDPQAPARGYLVAEHGGRLCGVVLRAPQAGTARRSSMCSLCLTVRSGGVSLMVAPRAGRGAQQGHSVGTYMCADLTCSLVVRGKAATSGPVVHETLTTEQRVARLTSNLDEFLARVLRPA
ncbi:FBP domain-containing protein [Nocardioides sp. URHA0020]|uniref:FBP domain-containing protein n=1 Tax=Nocardioides sp. URHA0020 TaxID=1380392 RepID=UPI00049035A0|nr:FBP domain-containing protein [Nocardioides sp. URHA0020]